MRRTLATWLSAAVLVGALAAAGCGAPKALEPTGTDHKGTDHTAAGGNNALHNDKFPCVASQAEVAGVTGHMVEYDSIEPDGRSCSYMLAYEECAYCTLRISVTDDVDKDQWRRENQTFPSWNTGKSMRGREVEGVGDEAFLSQLPGYEGQLDVLKGSRLVRVRVEIRDELGDAGVDRLIAFGKTVAARL